MTKRFAGMADKMLQEDPTEFLESQTLFEQSGMFESRVGRDRFERLKEA